MSGRRCEYLNVLFGSLIGTAGTSTSCAPSSRNVVLLFLDCVSGITITGAVASAFRDDRDAYAGIPAVPSTITPPGRNSPFSTAS